jgi:hypothetical protein
LKKLLRNVLRSSWVQRAVGLLAAEFLRLVWLTNKFSFDPPNVYEIVEPQRPVILAFWHGQHLMTPFGTATENSTRLPPNGLASAPSEVPAITVRRFIARAASARSRKCCGPSRRNITSP